MRAMRAMRTAGAWLAALAAIARGDDRQPARFFDPFNAIPHFPALAERLVCGPRCIAHCPWPIVHWAMGNEQLAMGDEQ